ncbi:Pfdn6 [Symbiodinium pilosum]|uniref:Pfdn6 protein n=1 Tax=Symbiodinium pilosum TaxID=2952 RepID=A0A812IP99_SYMPI|nr:Pfdn6 [Symbiodinium pilosum]
MKIQIPAMYVNSNSALALFFWIGGIFIEMGLLLNFVMIQPFTVDSCCVLVLCLGIVAVEQFNGSLRMRNWLLTATAFISAVILLLRYVLLIPFAQEWISGPHSPLPKEQFHLVWKAD